LDFFWWIYRIRVQIHLLLAEAHNISAPFSRNSELPLRSHFHGVLFSRVENKRSLLAALVCDECKLSDMIWFSRCKKLQIFLASSASWFTR